MTLTTVHESLNSHPPTGLNQIIVNRSPENAGVAFVKGANERN